MVTSILKVWPHSEWVIHFWTFQYNIKVRYQGALVDDAFIYFLTMHYVMHLEIGALLSLDAISEGRHGTFHPRIFFCLFIFIFCIIGLIGKWRKNWHGIRSWFWVLVVTSDDSHQSVLKGFFWSPTPIFTCRSVDVVQCGLIQGGITNT